MTSGHFTAEEISSQASVWRKLFEKFNVDRGNHKKLSELAVGRSFVVTGCGSTYYLSLSAAALLRQYGFLAHAVPGSELATFTQASLFENPWLLAISRSGRTSETLWAVKRFRESCPEGKVIAITCDAQSELAKDADFCLTASDAQEKSVVQTRSFTSAFFLTQLLVASLVGSEQMIEKLGQLPNQLVHLLDRVGDLPRKIGNDSNIQRLFFLGGGPFYGLACEATLKAKEMTLSWSEGYHPLEIRHGPMSVVDKNSLVVGFLSDCGFEAERRVLRDMKKLGAQVMVFTEDGSAFEQDEVDYLVDVRSGLSDWERGPLYLPVLHWIFYYRALSRGLNPDEPANLTAVVELS
ncbi:MAG: SIS domain-containing protein [Anaerolineae bacterium]|nr:SIS domain-containing protein [Anaerolineae bacterium]